MAVEFTIYTLYEKDNRIQQSNFYRWNRCLKTDKNRFEVIVFYFDQPEDQILEELPNLRFWRTHKDLSFSQTVLMNEAIRYSRSEILLYVSPDVLARKADLFRLANQVKRNYTLSWVNLKHAMIKKSSNGMVKKMTAIFRKISWAYQMGRIELYSQMNKPFTGLGLSFFAVRKPQVDRLFSDLSIHEKDILFQADSPGKSYLNYFFYHLIQKDKRKVCSLEYSRSMDFNFYKKKLSYFSSYPTTYRLIRLILKGGNFHYPLNVYRFILPVMQLTQIAFFLLVTIAPVYSLVLIAFYAALASGLYFGIFFKKRWKRPWAAPLAFLWYFSWLLA